MLELASSQSVVVTSIASLNVAKSHKAQLGAGQVLAHLVQKDSSFSSPPAFAIYSFYTAIPMCSQSFKYDRHFSFIILELSPVGNIPCVGQLSWLF